MLNYYSSSVATVCGTTAGGSPVKPGAAKTPAKREPTIPFTGTKCEAELKTTTWFSSLSIFFQQYFRKCLLAIMNIWTVFFGLKKIHKSFCNVIQSELECKQFLDTQGIFLHESKQQPKSCSTSPRGLVHGRGKAESWICLPTPRSTPS